MSSSSSSSVFDGLVFEPAGVHYASPSLTIDVANQSTLVASTKAAFGETFRQSLGWVAEDRLRGDMAAGDVEWQFTCAKAKSATTVVLTGETIAIYVATKGHGVGYLGDSSDGPVFSKTIIRITVQDTMRGVEKSVEFDGFSKSLSHPSRTFLWNVGDSGEWSAQSRTSTGVCGRYVLSVVDISEFYSNPDWTSRVEIPEGTAFPTPTARLQVLAYDWRDVLGRIEMLPSKNAAMLAGVDFRAISIDPDTLDDEASVFDSSTVFPTYDTAGLTDNQKATVLRDSAMVMLSSQGPILPADNPDAPVLGVGMTGVSLPVNRGALVAARPGAYIPASPSATRTFSLSGRPVASNLHDDLTAIVSERNQGDFKFSDPVRVLSDEIGVGWAMSGSTAQWMDVTTGASSRADILLGEEGFELDAEGDWASSSSSSSSVSSASSMSSASSQSSSSLSSVSSLSSQSSVSSASSVSSQSSQSSVSSFEYSAYRNKLGGGYLNSFGINIDGTVEWAGTGPSVSGVSGWTNIIAVNGGNGWALGLKSVGGVTSVLHTGNTYFDIDDATAWVDIVSISAKDSSGLGLKTGGSVVYAGYDASSHLSGTSSWSQIIAVAVGRWNHSLGLESVGGVTRVVAAGDNTYHQCEVTGWTDIIAIDAGWKHSLGLKSVGGVTRVVAAGDNTYYQCEVTGWTDIIAISTYFNHSLGLKSDGRVVAAGDNAYHQCEVTGWTSIIAIATGESYSIGLKSDGSVVGTTHSGNVSGWDLLN